MHIRLILNRYIRNHSLLKAVFVTLIFVIVVLFYTNHFEKVQNVVKWDNETNSSHNSNAPQTSNHIHDTNPFDKTNTAHDNPDTHGTTVLKPTSVPSGTHENTEKTHSTHGFFKQFFKILKKAQPTCEKLSDYNVGECPMKSSVAYWGASDVAKWKWLSYDNLVQCLKVDDASSNNLRKKHKYFMNNFVALYDSWESRIWNTLSSSSKSSSSSSLYQGNGIVVVGGGKYSVLSLLLIEALERQNNQLPIEILISPAEKENEKEYCTFLENNYNKYSAKCIYFDRVFSQDLLNSFEFKGFQYKSVALLASSFENVLLLDADNVPLTDISELFESHVYKKFGMILWPDIWRRSTNPKYYDIAGIKINFDKRAANLIDRFTPAEVYTPKDKLSDTKYLREEIPYHDFEGAIPEVSSETGQLLINKRTHMKTILLSFFYNVYGPDYYYPLFTQNMAGQGDKETFIAAAHVLKEPYYQVKSPCGMEGYHKQDRSGFRAVGIYQKNFMQDHALYELSKKEMYDKYDLEEDRSGNSKLKDASPYEYDPEYNPLSSYLNLFFKNKSKEPENMFAHCNYPKFDPIEMSAKKEFMWEGEHFRVFKKNRVNGFDVELSFYKTFDAHLCRKKKRVEFSYLNNKIKDASQWDEMCKFIREKLTFLQENKLV